MITGPPVTLKGGDVLLFPYARTETECPPWQAYMRSKLYEMPAESPVTRNWRVHGSEGNPDWVRTLLGVTRGEVLPCAAREKAKNAVEFVVTTKLAVTMTDPESGAVNVPVVTFALETGTMRADVVENVTWLAGA
jgi:hypothetical protein